ncbi:hypothetical protein ACWET9_41000 [Streptomyces sp. NPDC004059]
MTDLLAAAAEPGLMAIGSGRFFGWVTGGTLPAALAADWLVSAWDQNAGQRLRTPAVAALEEAAGVWLLDLRGLPATASVGFVTGATMANFTGLAAARQAVLARTGWDVSTAGLAGAPPVHAQSRPGRHAGPDSHRRPGQRDRSLPRSRRMGPCGRRLRPVGRCLPRPDATSSQG